jgi:hypothetical protein
MPSVEKVQFISLLVLSLALITVSTELTSQFHKTQVKPEANAEVKPATKTEAFIKQLDIFKYERNGSDFANPKYSPLRLGKPLDKIDITYDYDFKQLALTEKRLSGVNRREVLKYIFARVTQETKNNTEKHIAILKFLQKSSFHNKYMQPMYPNKTTVFDPLVLLELSEMRCGHVARIAVDLFEAGGMKGRLVQVASHVLAEVFYDNSWHYFDADLLIGEQTVLNENGSIASIKELSHKPYSIDAIPHAVNEISVVSGQSYKGSQSYPSFYYFHYEPSLSLYYQKVASQKEELNQYYGWNFYKIIPDKERQINHVQKYYQPGAVTLQNIQVDSHQPWAKRSIEIEWSPSKDLDRDVLGYKVYVSKHTRGWSYSQFTGSKKLEKFHNKVVWKPEMYENIYKEPPDDIALIKTTQNQVSIPIKEPGTYYITVMPYDAHGESVGRKLYLVSEEIKVQV